MKVVHIVFSPISGIFLDDFDELNLSHHARLFRNPAISPFWQTDLERLGVPTPNVYIPFDAVIEGAPPPPFDADIKLLGIARYLLEIEIETPTNELPDSLVKEELEWAVLPLRILISARVLTGLSVHCRGGCISSGLLEGGIKEKMRQEGLLTAAPEPQGLLPFRYTITTITREAAKKITEFATVLNKYRDVLSAQFAVAIDNFSDSYYLASHTDRAINLLWALESLFCEKGLKQGREDRTASGVAKFLASKDRVERERIRRLIGEKSVFKERKDIEHGRKSKGIETEKYFRDRLEKLETVVRQVLYAIINLLDQHVDLTKFLPGLRNVSTPNRNQGK